MKLKLCKPHSMLLGLILLLCTVYTAQAQTPDPSAALQIDATDKGLLPPRMTEAQMNAISAPAEGLIIYCTDCTSKGFRYYDGTEWLRFVGESDTSTPAEILVQIGLEGDDPDTVNSVVTATEIASIPTITGVDPSNETAYQDYIDNNPDLFSSPATVAEVQDMVTAVNSAAGDSGTSVLVQIGNEGDNPDVVESVVSATQIASIPGIMGVDPANEVAYRTYIDANPDSFSSPATVAEVQAMIDAVNTSQDVLVQIGNEGDDPDVVDSVVTAAEIASIDGITGVDLANETAYQDYIDNNPNDFSSPATVAEVQAMIDAVNNPNVAPTASSVSFSGTLEVGMDLTGSYTYNDTDGDAEGTSTYQWYRADDNTGTNQTAISGATSQTYTLVAADEGKYIAYGVTPVAATGTSPGTEVVSAYQGAVTPTITIPATITLATEGNSFIASIFDNDYLPYTAPTGPATTGSSNAGGGTETTIDVQGTLTTTGITINLPVTATGDGTLPAYSVTADVTNSLAEDGVGRTVSFSWPETAYTASTTSIPVTIASTGGDLNAKKLDINAGVGNDGLGVLLAMFSYPYNNAGDMGSYNLRDISGIRDREFGDGAHDFIYLPIEGEDGNIWLNNNLGASYADTNHASFNPAQQATSEFDNLAFGSLYQFGRYSDGHELVTSVFPRTGINGVTNVLSTTATPGHGDFIQNDGTAPMSTGNAWHDFSTISNHSLWQGEAGVNNPCPEGFRLATEVEFTNLISAASITGRSSGVNSNLAFTPGGVRGGSTASITATNGNGIYWTSTVDSLGLGHPIYFVIFTSSTSNFVTDAANGASVRCILD